MKNYKKLTTIEKTMIHNLITLGYKPKDIANLTNLPQRSVAVAAGNLNRSSSARDTCLHLN